MVQQQGLIVVTEAGNEKMDMLVSLSCAAWENFYIINI